FDYKVCDDGTTAGAADHKCDTGHVTVTVSEVNDAPAATDDARNATEDTAAIYSSSGLTANDSAGPANEADQTLTLTEVSNAAHGTVSPDRTSGDNNSTPAADYNGNEAGFDYKVCDDGTTAGAADHKCDTGHVTVTVSEVNDAPTATDDDRNATEDTAAIYSSSGLTANDSAGPANESDQTLTLTEVSNAAHGT